jgi:hypothetical protein
MVDLQRVELVLVGPYAGKTITLNGHRYVGGIARIDVRAEQIELLLRSAARSYNAYPAGSEALAQAQERSRGNGRAGTDEAKGSEDRRLQPALGEVRLRPEHPAAQVPDVHGRGDDADSRSAVWDSANRDRYADTRIPRQAHHGEHAEHHSAAGPEVNLKLLASVRSLDHDNDELWTAEGLPKLSAVEEAYGSAGLTREDVETVAPAWSREKASAAALDALF